jgi:hypothetical protein
MAAAIIASLQACKLSISAMRYRMADAGMFACETMGVAPDASPGADAGGASLLAQKRP